MPKVTTNSITARAMRDICKEAIPLYLRRKGATDIDMLELERLILAAVQEAHDVAHKLGYGRGHEVGYDIGYQRGKDQGYTIGFKNGKAAGANPTRRGAKKVGSGHVIVVKPEAMDARVAKKVANAIKKTRRVMAAKELS